MTVSSGVGWRVGIRSGLRKSSDNPDKHMMHIPCRLPAIFWALGETTSDDMIDRGRCVRLKAQDRNRFAIQYRRDQACLTRAHEGFLSSRHLVKDRAKREDVCSRIGVLAFELLRR